MRSLLLTALILTASHSSYAENFSVSETCSSEAESNSLGSLEEALAPIAEVLNILGPDALGLRNADLVKSAKWTFGKSQKGFEIYIPLIKKTIGTSANFDTPAFAYALKAWQEKKGYSRPSGVLDVSAFGFLKDFWQAERNLENPFIEKKMVQISTSYRYEANRENSLSMVGEKTYSAYQKMIAAARKDGLSENDLKIVASNRTASRLKMLQKQSGKRSIGYSIAGKKSVHFSGRALDLYVGGDPVNSSHKNRLEQSKSKSYLWLVNNGAKFGFRNYFYEPWHWEYVGGEN